MHSGWTFSGIRPRYINHQSGEKQFGEKEEEKKEREVKERKIASGPSLVIARTKTMLQFFPKVSGTGARACYLFGAS